MVGTTRNGWGWEGSDEGDLHGQTKIGKEDTFIIKFNPGGAREWTRILGAYAGYVNYPSISTSNDGSIYIAGTTGSAFDGQTMTGDKDAYISKYNPDGTREWSRFHGDPDLNRERPARFTSPVDIKTSSDGSIYMAGFYEESDAWNGADRDAFINKYSPDGTMEWTRAIGGKYTYGSSITIGSDGSVYIAGSTGDKELNGQPNANPQITSASRDGFIVKYTPDGTKEWTRLFGGFDYDQGKALATGRDGSIYIAGYTEGGFDGFANIDRRNGFISKYNPDGTKVWTELFGGDSYVWADGLTIGLDGSIYITGVTRNDLTVPSRNDEEYSEFIIKYNPSSNESTIKIATVNSDYTPHEKGFASINAPAPVIVTAFEVGTETTLDSIKDYDGNLHAGDDLEETASSYKYQGMLDVNGDGVFEAIFTNKVSKRWVTAKVDSTTGQIDFNDNGAGGGTRVVGIYEDPLIAEGSNNGGFLSDGVTPAPANFGVSEEERFVEVNGETIDRLALNSQVRFQNDLDIDNLSAKHSGDYDSDGVSEVYWKTNDGTAYLRALMHDDGNIRYANYQSEDQMSSYLTDQGHENIIGEII
jgi:hypothetical protein